MVGGIEVAIAHVQRNLRERGHEVLTFAPAYPGRQSHEPDVYRLPSLRISRSRDLRLGYALSRSARRESERLDVVHCQTPWTIGLMGCRIARARGIPRVYTYHALIKRYRQAGAQGFPGFPGPVVDSWLRFFLSRCDMVIAPSSDAQQEVESYGSGVPVRVIPSGLDPADFGRCPAWDPRSELGVRERHVLLFVGRLGKEKNVGFILRAFRVLLDWGEDARLIIVGDGPSMEALKREAVDLGLESRTTFSGFLPRDRVVDLNRQADLFVFGSKTETQGLVILEAMMAGTAIVAVDAPGVRDMVRSGTDGMLVPEDEHRFASCCRELLGDDGRRETMAASARDRAQRFTAQASVDQLISVYEHLVEQSAQRRRRP